MARWAELSAGRFGFDSRNRFFGKGEGLQRPHIVPRANVALPSKCPSRQLNSALKISRRTGILNRSPRTELSTHEEGREKPHECPVP